MCSSVWMECGLHKSSCQLSWPCYHVQVGEIYVLATLVTLILCNLGTRKEGEASAYSIFNGFRELPGQLNANVLDDQIRRGQM